jgi:hypothetical protein
MTQKSTSTRILIAVLLSVILLTACGEKATEVPAAAATPDPCAPENVSAEVDKVNDLMREFDDGAQLASYAPAEQLVTIIPSLQDVRRRAEDLVVPACLDPLKTYQLGHMNTVINTLLLFMQGTTDNTEAVVDGINQARALHERYNQEMANLLGVDYIPAGGFTPTP